MPINSFLYPAPSNSDNFEVANSLRFDDGSSDSLTMTPSGSPTNADKNTLSMWVKLGVLGTNRSPIFANSNAGGVNFRTDDKIDFYNAGGSLRTTQVFRDPSAWYHLVFTTDTTDGTADDRLKIYVNGVQITSFDSRSNPSQNTNSNLGSANEHRIGANNDPANFFDGYMAEFCFIDGQALTPTSFGEFDSASPTIWKPKEILTQLNFGTNGFYLQFKNSSSLGADSSSNGNNFTVNNLTSVDQSTDTCTNNFCTLNPNMAYPSTNITISDGNLDATRSAGTAWQNILSTFAPSSGKWYAEVKVTGVGSNGVNIGFANIDVSNIQNVTTAFGEDANSAGIYSPSGAIFYNSGTTFATVGSYTAGDIIQLAMDIDNGYLYWGKNGTYLNSGDPTSGSSGTGGLALSNLTSGGSYAMGVSLRNSGDVTWNFGSPAFSISSGNSDAEGFGNFEYAVPSGYFALCTKNLAEYG